jgi:hypothetical protein
MPSVYKPIALQGIGSRENRPSAIINPDYSSALIKVNKRFVIASI